MSGKYQLRRSSNDQFYFNLKAGNGEIILTSETYTTKSSAEKGIEAVRKNAPMDDSYDRRAALNGYPYFILKAANGEVIGRSETYSSEAAMERGIEAVKKNATSARINDLTNSLQIESSQVT